MLQDRQARRRARRGSLVLLNWNGGKSTLPRRASVYRGTLRPWRTIVFDNASTDGSPDAIERAFPDVTIVRSPENVGFAAGNNRAARQLLDEGADLLWILNNDTVVDPDCLRRLVDECVRDPSLAVVTGKILFERPSDRIWYAGGGWGRWAFTVSHRGYGERDRGQYDLAADVDFVSGCCMLVPRATVERTGLFDERYFAYAEDTDLCMRLRERGHRLRYAPGAVLWHKVSASVRKNTVTATGGSATPLAHYLNHRNRLFYTRRHARRPLQFASAMGHFFLGTAYVAAA